jgi:hypothetical protein
MKKNKSRRKMLSRVFARFTLCLISGVGAFQSSSFAQSLSEPFTLRENFQHDSLGQIASYPPVQDTGYEPSITPTTDYNAPEGRALMRVVKPNRNDEMRFGFIRQTFLQMNENAKISFAYYLNHAGARDQIEIGIAGSDGCRYEKQIPAKTNGWINEEIALTDFRCDRNKALTKGVGIEAFYIVANLERADQEAVGGFERCRPGGLAGEKLGRLGLDAVELAGHRSLVGAARDLDPVAARLLGGCLLPCGCGLVGCGFLRCVSLVG